MHEVQKNSVLAAAMLALLLPSFALADAVPEPASYESEPDGADTSVQLEVDSPKEGATDTGVKDDAGVDEYSDLAEDNHDQSEHVGADAADENYITDEEDAWVTTMGDDENQIYFEFAGGAAPSQQDDDPNISAPAAKPHSILAASDDVDITLGINVHNKAAVAAQCADLQQSRQTYHAFYKLYCD